MRVADLIGWGGERAAARYVETIARVQASEQARLPGSTAVTEAVARGLHKLTAYKDEYEVARLHVDGARDLPRGTKVSIHLHPPLLRALGMRRKLKLGAGSCPCCGSCVTAAACAARRSTRSATPTSAASSAPSRRVPRARRPRARAPLARHARTAIEIAELPELVRGYEEIKLAGVERFRARGSELLAQLDHVRAPELTFAG